jgi:hypothetical protein
MVNKEKALERELIRLRKSQNTEQVNFRRMRKLRKARTEYWKLRKKPSIAVREVPKVEKEKRKSRKERRLDKKEEEPLPELEVVEDEPELEVVEEDTESGSEDLADELEDLYTYDEDIEEEKE